MLIAENVAVTRADILLLENQFSVLYYEVFEPHQISFNYYD